MLLFGNIAHLKSKEKRRDITYKYIKNYVLFRITAHDKKKGYEPQMKTSTKAILWFSAVILLVFIIAFANTPKESYKATPSIPPPAESPISTAIPTKYKTGLHFPKTNATTQYNGYTYEMYRIEEEINNRIHQNTFLYRYTDPNNKIELCHLGSGAVYGFFIDNKLYYFADGMFKKLDLDTILQEYIYTNNSANYFFKYDNYVFFPSNTSVARLDLISETSTKVITSQQLNNYERLNSENVFACNNTLWFVVSDSHIGGSFYKSNLDGSGLTYAGFTVSDYNELNSVNEYKSYIVYITKDNTEKKLSLIDGSEVTE